MICTDYWQDLISSSLLHLAILNFKFRAYFYQIYDRVLNALNKFQSDFWVKEHQWYTMYEVYENLAIIYTVPYAWNKYEIVFEKLHSSDSLLTNLNSFDNVTDLTVQIRAILEGFQYYFSNVESLKLTNMTRSVNGPIDYELRIEHIVSLKKIMNFSKVIYLNICRGFLIESSVLLEILKEASQLSSLSIGKSTLISFLNNSELCTYLNQMIFELHIDRCDHDVYMKSNELDLFCKTFSKLKDLECCLNRSDDFLFILNHLPKLTDIKVHYSSHVYSEKRRARLEKSA